MNPKKQNLHSRPEHAKVTPANTHDQAGSAAGAPVEVSVIIKTLNEEKNIARAIESATAALSGLRGEIIVADSLSTDATVDIASNYPATVVQLSNPEDRCCGAGPQLGFQYASGEFLYILDGDMELSGQFVAKAVDFMRSHPDVAGVAGLVEELGGGNYEFEARKSQGASWGTAGVQRWLDMGGLYRRDALNRVGYFSNRNLHACEEQDLGMRLGLIGYRLVRLPIPAVRHYGRREASWTLMRRRFASHYSDGPGELARAALGTPLLWRALRSHAKLVAMAGLWLATAIGLALAPWHPGPLVFFGSILAGVALAMLAKKRSLALAAMGLANWALRTAGFVRGLFNRQKPPQTWLESTVVTGPKRRSDSISKAHHSSEEARHA